MKTRVFLIIIALVVLPTAILSIMAGRALRNWEVVLERGLETAAGNAIESMADQTHARLVDDMKRVKTAMTEVLAAGSDSQNIQATATRLENSGQFIGKAYLFVNPVGFIHPLRKRADVPDPDMDTLEAALKRAIQANGKDSDAIRFVLNNNTYCFAPIPERSDLFCGYLVDQRRFESELSRTIASLSGGGFKMVAEGPGLKVGAPRYEFPSEVIVSDSLSGPEEVAAGDPGRDKPVAAARLYPPFDYVMVSAYLSDSKAMMQAGRFRAKLYGWGIILLVAVIIAGLWLAFRAAALEIAKAGARSDFVIGVSHDLRTPLASMKMLAESLFLGRVADGEKQKQFLGTIVREAQRLSQLIERVLFLVRFGQDSLLYMKKTVDVGLVITRAVESFKASVIQLTPGATKEDISLSVERGIPTIQVDDSALTQVVLNLLDNAWKYGRKTPDASAHTPIDSSLAVIQVKVAVEETSRKMGRKRKWIRVSVADRGPGIAPHDLKHVFRKFYRAAGAGEKNTSGVGLGLALCKHMAEGHGGWVEARSVYGQGAEFSTYLPVEA